MPVGVVNLLRARQHTQRLTRSDLRAPGELVAAMGAVQSQDYAGAAWGLGQRLDGVAAADIDRAFDEGRILRTHILRPTWHFVAPADIRWMLTATGPRVQALSSYYYRVTELDAKVFTRARAILRRALRDGTSLTRSELAAAFARGGIVATGLRLGLLVMHEELEQVICSGPRRGKHFTYALLEERAPTASRLRRDEAIVELARRYFASHGPATLRDYVWWSGLTVGEARAGLDAIRQSLEEHTLGGLTYWCAPGALAATPRLCAANLLPNYDEYLIAYKDRGLVVDGRRSGDALVRSDAFVHHLVIDGRLAGSWRRTLSASAARIDVACYEPPSAAQRRAIAAAARRYARFVGRELVLTETGVTR